MKHFAISFEISLPKTRCIHWIRGRRSSSYVFNRFIPSICSILTHCKCYSRNLLRGNRRQKDFKPRWILDLEGKRSFTWYHCNSYRNRIQIRNGSNQFDSDEFQFKRLKILHYPNMDELLTFNYRNVTLTLPNLNLENCYEPA